MNETNETVTEPSLSPEAKVLTEIQMYYTPILVLLGTTGNCLSVIVFATAKLRTLSSSYYLAGLAVSDTCYLISLFFVWLNLVDVPLFNQHGFCQALMYCTYLCSFLSVWFVVAFTVERFVAVRYPLHRPSMCTVTRAKAVLLGLTMLGMVLYGPMLFIVAPVYVESWHKSNSHV
ncbi:hypothetical protein B566_EDAN014933 [Ephemera danica]|nr:hypothetical protein B566_EDAN014933 [Ephemera danica]